MSRGLSVQERAERDAVVLGVLRDLPGREFYSADLVQRMWSTRTGIRYGSPGYIGAQGMGRILSRMASAGHVERSFSAASGRYRAAN